LAPIQLPSKSRWGLAPIIVNLYPNSQTPADFYWWSYPPPLSRHIIEIARTHGLPMRPAFPAVAAAEYP
jgi:hypothetical protein